jgi:large subunit ribosomal protein L16
VGLLPKKTKYRKSQRRKMKGNASAGTSICFGEFGLKVLEPIWLKASQIEAARRAMAHFVKRGGKIWIRVCCDKPVSARPAETRMGGGKGAPAFFAARVKPGHILFELAGVSHSAAQEAMRLAGSKLPVKTKFFVKA